MAKEEQVLVIERKVLEQTGMFQGITFDVGPYLSSIFVEGVPRFMLRSRVENDPSLKQLIPYVLMICDGKCLSYVRGTRAGETRLVGKRSIGIGGHIDKLDHEKVLPLFDRDLRKAYSEAVEREVTEEVNVRAGHTDRIVALLNDDSTEVGQVHLGIVHLWELDAPNVTKREQMITQLVFESPTELAKVRDTFETWSTICLDNLDELMSRANTG